MEFEVDGECHEVEAGDSIHFRSVRPHSWRNPDRRARAGRLARGPGVVAMRIVVAIGGNALIAAGEDGAWERQLAHAREIAEEVVALRRAGHQLVLTHGNGPQVGLLALAMPALPLDVLTAMTQGQIGYLLETAIGAGRPARADRHAAHARGGRPRRPRLRDADQAGRPVLRRRARRAGWPWSAAGRWPTTPAAAGGAMVASPRPLEVLGADERADAARRRRAGDRRRRRRRAGRRPSAPALPGVVDKDRCSAELALRRRRRPADPAHRRAARGDRLRHALGARARADHGLRRRARAGRAASSRPAAWDRRSSRRGGSSRAAATP